MSEPKGVAALKDIDVMPRTLAAKILKVSEEIGCVKKGKAPAGGVNFEYQGWEAVMPAVRNACLNNGLCLVPSFTLISAERAEKNGKLWTFVYVAMSLLIKDAETGESIVMEFIGESAGVDDKGVQKAITSATKYAYLKLFQIPTVDDAKDDPDGHAPPPADPYKVALSALNAPKEWLQAFAAKHGPVGKGLIIEAHQMGCKTTAQVDAYLETGEVPS